jgi:hypothetical protein
MQTTLQSHHNELTDSDLDTVTGGLGGDALLAYQLALIMPLICLGGCDDAYVRPEGPIQVPIID